jgi:hypothetical protein
MALGYYHVTSHDKQRPRGALCAASRHLQGGYAMIRRSIHLIRVSRDLCGKMVGIYRSVAFVCHLVHLGPRYASTSFQVILSWSLSASVAPLDWYLRLDSSAGLELGPGPGPGPGSAMDSFWSCVVLPRKCHRTPTFLRTQPPYHSAESPKDTLCPMRRDPLHTAMNPGRSFITLLVARLPRCLPSLRWFFCTLSADGFGVFRGSGRAKGASLLRRLAVQLPRPLMCLLRVIVALAVGVESEDWAKAGLEGQW